MTNNISTDELYNINHGDSTWVAISTCLAFIMFPGLGYFYGGIAHRKNLLTILLSTTLGLSVVSIQWFLWGYSLSFSETGSAFIGNFDNAFFMGVGTKPHPNGPTIPSNLFVLFQGMFAALTPAIAFGSAAERTTLPAYLVFLSIWTTIVYNFITYWCWAPNGWLRAFDVLDYAGGTPVHITSGFSAIAYALSVGPRRTINFKTHKPSSISDVFLGTALLWFGWFGFNGGSELAMNSRATNAMLVTNIAGSFGGLTWMFTEMIYSRTPKMTLSGFCCGAVAGLVTITPAAGFVSPHYAVIFGILGGLVCFFSCFIKKLTKYKYDDACDVFGVHGVGGILGCLLTGIFADNRVAAMSGGEHIKGGWINGHWMQILYQLLSVVVTAAWAFIFTFLIFLLIKVLPFIRLKLTEEEERIGGDWINLGEIAYGHDVFEGQKSKIKPVEQKEPIEISSI